MTDVVFPASCKGALIVSCQAPPGDPLEDTDCLTRIARSAARGGAGGLRANGPECVEAFRRETRLPVIGIWKRKIDGAISITPDFASAEALALAGAEVIALDCSAARPEGSESWRGLIGRIHEELNRPVLADVATLDDALAAEAAGADAVATTMYGFTPETAGARAVNWAMVEEMVKRLGVPVIVEGHISQPEEARRALEMGAYAVVVGAAITRPESISTRFVAAMR
ncbi:MAG: N-acetylmannosamine-6-phosphate 2-epimerase [Acidobacteriaceae bacterium]